MYRVSNIVRSVFVVCAAMLVASCNNDADTILTQQQNGIQTYLKGSHQPKLIPESELSASLEANPPFYTQWGIDLFRYISTYYDEGRDARDEIVWGSSVDIVYTAYIFTSGKPNNSAIYATNDQATLDILRAEGLNTEYEWSTDPYRIVMGDSEVVEGLETALIGCREGDKMEIYMTYEMAYGKQYIGMVPSKSAVVWYVDVVGVE